MRRFGLIGRSLAHSFSQQYFQDKFRREGIEDCSYENLEFATAVEIADFLTSSKHEGLNVTIPYKSEVLNSVQGCSSEVEKIGAANTLVKTSEGWFAHNTDVHGFRMLLRPHLRGHHRRALVLGTGGASKAVAFVLEKLGLDFVLVSRQPNDGQVGYSELNANAVRDFNLIINTTPLGTFPDVDECPNIPYEHLSSENLLIDLVYNPDETLFMKKGKAQGAMVANGLEMLKAQAEKAWEIWNSNSE